MKKILFSIALTLACLVASSQIIVSGDITTSTTWTNNNIYLLNGWVYVKAGATLTIEPGTIIKGDFVTKGALIIERDADIIADGTPEQPIVFTSQKAVGLRSYGDWGGVIICGRASVNAPANAGNGTGAGEAIIEGGVGSIYGGGATPDDNDNSGILRYVRIEFGGIPFQPNSEINGLTLGGVGRGTIVENVQVSFSGDDAFEWFGGTVNCKNLIAHRNWDDDFDTDFGYRGNVQFAMSVRDPAVADQSGSNGFESDNDGSGTGNTPITRPIFSNVTIIGPLVNSATPNSNYKRAAHLRRNTQTSIFNSVFAGYGVGLLVDGTSTHANAINGDMRFKNCVLAAMSDSLATASAANPNNITGNFNISDWFGTMTYANELHNTTSELMFANTQVASPQLTLMDGSPLMSGASFSDSYLADAFFAPVAFRGAFGTEDWTACWAEWDPQNNPYNGAINNAITATIQVNGASTVCEGETMEMEVITNATNATINWSNGGNTEVITVTAPAIVSVMVTNAAGCSAQTDDFVANVFPTPSVTISAEGPTSFCTGSSVVLSSSAASGNLWSNNAASSSITISVSGNYNLTYTDENGCTAQSNSIEVNVSDAPAPTISTNGATTFCEGESVVLSASNSETYQWSLNGMAVPNATAQTWTATAGGAYSVTVTNTDQCDGVGTSSLVFVVVNPTPTAGFDFDFTYNGYTYDFNNNSTGATSYEWNFGDGSTSTEANPSHTFATGGTHVVTLTAINGQCEDVIEITITGVAVEENELVTNLSLYPNPTSGNALVSMTLNGSHNVMVSVYELTGKMVYNTYRPNSFGTQNIELPASELSAGIYLVQVQVGSTTQMIKLVVNK
jgi:PKD repeat protein